MPLLTLLGGAAALAAGALGVGGHLDAQEKNEQAEQIRDMAKTSYDATKAILNLDIKITQQNLIELGTTKQKVLESSMERFIRSYEKIKEIQMSTNGEVDDLASFQFSSEDMVEIQQLDSNYESAVSNDAADAADAAAREKLLKILPGVGQHRPVQLADVREERLAVKCRQPDLVQHHVVDRCVGKAEKHFAGDGPAQFVVVEQIGEQPIGVVPADGAEDHIDLRVAERREKIRRAILRMVLYMLDTGERVRHEPDVEPIVRKALCADIQLMLCKALPQHTGGKAHDRNVFYHDIHLFFRHYTIGSPPAQLSSFHSAPFGV